MVLAIPTEIPTESEFSRPAILKVVQDNRVTKVLCTKTLLKYRPNRFSTRSNIVSVVSKYLFGIICNTSLRILLPSLRKKKAANGTTSTAENILVNDR